MLNEREIQGLFEQGYVALVYRRDGGEMVCVCKSYADADQMVEAEIGLSVRALDALAQ